MEYDGNLSSFLFQDKLFAKNSADFFKALIRLLYLVKPCPSSSKTIYSTSIPLFLNLPTIWIVAQTMHGSMENIALSFQLRYNTGIRSMMVKEKEKREN